MRWCEQKAASNAIYIIINNAEKPELVEEMTNIAIEEMEHFRMVLNIIKERGLTFGRERKDDYVNDLIKFCKKDGSRNDALIERLLFAADQLKPAVVSASECFLKILKILN